MMVTTKTTITFHIPDEYALALKFSAQNPDWVERCDSMCIGFTKQNMYAIDVKEEGEQNEQT